MEATVTSLLSRQWGEGRGSAGSFLTTKRCKGVRSPHARQEKQRVVQVAAILCFVCLESCREGNLQSQQLHNTCPSWFLFQPACSDGDPLCSCSQGLHNLGQTYMVWRELPGGDRADPGKDTVREQQTHLLAWQVSTAGEKHISCPLKTVMLWDCGLKWDRGDERD